MVRAQWLQDRQADLIAVDYFHVVFTMPGEIAAIAYQNKAVVYEILFYATAETLRMIAADPKHLGAESASSPYCILGGRICCITRICIVWFRAAV